MALDFIQFGIVAYVGRLVRAAHTRNLFVSFRIIACQGRNATYRIWVEDRRGGSSLVCAVGVNDMQKLAEFV
jgi:hypothetical protein